MFHIGVATQHPPLPDANELSELGTNFIKKCLTVDAVLRPTASELMNHPWMVQFMDTLRSYEEEELATAPLWKFHRSRTSKVLVSHDRRQFSGRKKSKLLTWTRPSLPRLEPKAVHRPPNYDIIVSFLWLDSTTPSPLSAYSPFSSLVFSTALDTRIYV